MENILTGVSVPAIAAAVYFVIELIKYTTNNSERVKRVLPLVSAITGVLFGMICFYFVPGIIPTDNVVISIVIGAASGLAATGFDQIIKQSRK